MSISGSRREWAAATRGVAATVEKPKRGAARGLTGARRVYEYRELRARPMSTEPCFGDKTKLHRVVMVVQPEAVGNDDDDDYRWRTAVFYGDASTGHLEEQEKVRETRCS